VARYAAPVALTADHETGLFDCGSGAQTEWLRRHALAAHGSGTARVYVSCCVGERRVVGYYALAAGSVAHEGAPARVVRGVGRHPIPVILLTRLDVDLTEQGHGLGRALLRDALMRVAVASEMIGARALLVHAESDRAREFYLRIAEFEVSPSDPLHLFLLLKDLRASLREAASRTRE
jgi:GNAT superfamily N-acetyltransferase